MKKIYSRICILTLFLGLGFLSFKGYSQTCPNSGTPGTAAFDTTIAFGTGVVATDVKFPKFDPQNGMVTCVKLCVTIKGIIDTVAFENLTGSAQTASYTYTRKDTIRGPGIPTYLTSNANIPSSTIPLGPTDGWNNSGPDFYSNGPDTILTRVLCSNISDSTTIVQFYGVNDSVTYNYAIDAAVSYLVTGGSAATLVLSSALVNFHFEYCTCPALVLPLNIHQFNITKLTADKAELKWIGLDDPERNYHYEVEVSKDGYHFSSIGSLEKSPTDNSNYRYVYSAGGNNINPVYFFRIKQVYSNGYTRFSEIRSIELKSSGIPKFNFYPNPSDGIVGIKFDDNFGGKLSIQIFNTQGQTVMNKEIFVSGTSYCQIATLQRGIYWLKLTDVTNRLSCVNQLLIK